MFFGALAQLGERMAGSHEVRGSIPLGSTINDAGAVTRLLFYFAETPLREKSDPAPKRSRIPPSCQPLCNKLEDIGKNVCPISSRIPCSRGYCLPFKTRHVGRKAQAPSLIPGVAFKLERARRAVVIVGIRIVAVIVLILATQNRGGRAGLWTRALGRSRL